MPVLLPEEIAQWSGCTWDPCAPAPLDGVSNDSRTIKTGSLYVAIRGGNFDGHDFVDAAFERGAGAALVDNRSHLSASRTRPLMRCGDTEKALRDIAGGYRHKLAPCMIGITGSAGKTTVKEMVAQILATAGPVASTKGNWNNHIGLPLSLLAMEPETATGVFEIGTNHPGELAILCGVLCPSWGVVTNVGPVHIEHFGSVKAIADEKATLLRSLPPDGIAFLNTNGGCFDRMLSAVKCRLVTVSVYDKADYMCGGRIPGNGGVMVKESATGEDCILHISAPGEHNVINAMLAVAVARSRGLGWEQIGRALEGYRQLPMRWERMEIGGLNIVNDAYNANPMSMQAAIRTFAEERSGGAKWLVLGGMLELGEQSVESHAALGKSIASGSWRGIITVGDPGRLIIGGARSAGFPSDSLFECAEHDDAAGVLIGKAEKGDAVLFKASRGIQLEKCIEILRKHYRR